jgi:general stress protein CsbA
VLRETTSRGLCGLVCPSRLGGSDQRNGGSDQPDSQNPTPRSAHRQGESLEHCPAHEEEWKSPPIKASTEFHTHVVLCNEGGQEKARKEYYAARMKRARKSGSALSSLLELKQDAGTMARGLADLKKRLDGETARVGASKACEDQDILRSALLSFDEIEGDLAKARQPLGRCWALLEFGNVADVMIPEVHAAREDVGRQQQLARTLSADIAAKRREYTEQTTELQRVSKLRECHQPWSMAYSASKCITELIDFRRLQATKEACERQGEVSSLVWQESDPAKFKSSLNLAAGGWKQRLEEFAKKLDTFDGHLSEVPQKNHHQLRHQLLKKVLFIATFYIKYTGRLTFRVSLITINQFRALMLALVLLRASSKQDALKMMWELSSLSEKRGVLPNMLTMLCMVRCCALLPCYAEVKKPFMVKDDTGFACPLGLPTSRDTDCRRMPLALSAPYRFWIERGEGTDIHLVLPRGKTLEQQLPLHQQRINVLQLAPICRINSEWVRVRIRR